MLYNAHLVISAWICFVKRWIFVAPGGVIWHSQGPKAKRWSALSGGGGGARTCLLQGSLLLGLSTPVGREGRSGRLDLSASPLFLKRPSVAPSRSCGVVRAAAFGYSDVLTARQNIVSDFSDDG